jgi:quaternary ammonium compound-resistance protein SugE
MSPSLAWIFLIASGLADVAWAVSTKYSNGYTKYGWAAVSIVSLLVFITLLTQALKVLPLGSAYAIWTGIGAVGSIIAGAFLFGETITVAKLGLIVLILASVVGLKVVS